MKRTNIILAFLLGSLGTAWGGLLEKKYAASRSRSHRAVVDNDIDHIGDTMPPARGGATSPPRRDSAVIAGFKNTLASGLAA